MGQEVNLIWGNRMNLQKAVYFASRYAMMLSLVVNIATDLGSWQNEVRD